MADAISAWHFWKDGTSKGPFTDDQMNTLFEAGAIDEETQVSSDGGRSWVSVAESELRSFGASGNEASRHTGRGFGGSDEEAFARVFGDPIINKDDTSESLGNETNPDFNHSSIKRSKKILYKNTKISKFLLLLIWICIIISATQAYMIIRIEGGARERLELVRMLESENFAAVSAIPILLAIIFYLIWKYRVSVNIWANRGEQTISPAGAVYWYFVPFAWFWKPFEAMRNIYDGLGLEKRGLLWGWWLMFWLTSLVTLFLTVVTNEPIRTIGAAQAYTLAAAVINAGDAIWLFIAARLIKQVSDAEKAMMS